MDLPVADSEKRALPKAKIDCENEFGVPCDRAYKALQLKLWSCRAPHMSTFHVSWTSFFIVLIGVFGVAPLMETIRRPDIGIGLSEYEVSMIHGASMAAFPYRFVMGTLCDRYGARKTLAATMILASIPCGLMSLCQTAWQLGICRFMTGVLWAVAVGCQVQMSRMFSTTLIGTANGLCLGIGSAGSGVALLIMPQINYLLVRLGLPEKDAWRVALLVPAFLVFIAGLNILLFAYDSPREYLRVKYKKQKEAHERMIQKRNPTLSQIAEQETHFSFLQVSFRDHPGVSPWDALQQAVEDPRSWYMHVGCMLCLGVGWVISNVIVRYYEIYRGMDERTAGIIGALFGINNCYARVAGGMLSDAVSRRWGVRARVRCFFGFLIAEAITMFAFSQVQHSALLLVIFMLLATFVQICEGFAFSIIPLINIRIVGTVASVSGAGANVGSVAFFFLFAWPFGQPAAFAAMSLVILLLAPIVLLVRFDTGVPEPQGFTTRSFKKTTSSAPPFSPLASPLHSFRVVDHSPSHGSSQSHHVTSPAGWANTTTTTTTTETPDPDLQISPTTPLSPKRWALDDNSTTTVRLPSPKSSDNLADSDSAHPHPDVILSQPLLNPSFEPSDAHTPSSDHAAERSHEHERSPEPQSPARVGILHRPDALPHSGSSFGAGAAGFKRKKSLRFSDLPPEQEPESASPA